MPMANVSTGQVIAANDHNSIVAAIKGTTGENLTVFTKGADLASASALVLGTDGNYFDVTGAVTITSISTLPAGTVIKLQFDSTPVLTHNATTLILQGAVNYTAAAGDVFEFISEGSGNWRETGRSLNAMGASVGSTATSVASAWGATPSLTFSTTNAAGTGVEFVRRNATIALFDTTVARALAFGDVGTVGSSGGFAAHVLHGHPFALGAAVVPSTGNLLSVASTNGNLQWAAAASGSTINIKEILYQRVATNETTTSTSAGDLTTVMTLTTGSATLNDKLMVRAKCDTGNSVTAQGSIMYSKLDAAAAVIGAQLNLNGAPANAYFGISLIANETGLSAATHTEKIQYSTTGTDTSAFRNRDFEVERYA